MTNNVLDIQHVNSLTLYCESKKKKSTYQSNNRYSNIINTDLNNHGYNDINSRSFNKQLNEFSPIKKIDKMDTDHDNIHETLYKIIFEKIKNLNSTGIPTYNNHFTNANLEILTNINKNSGNIPISNFEEVFDKHFSDIIYLIYFFFNSHCLVI